jgi:hypothetical protein
MTEPHEVWQLGRWIASREGGAARLTWTDGEMVVRLSDGRVRFVEGLDTTMLSRRLECESADCGDLLEEARTLARDREVAETHAMSAAKEVLQENLSAWLLDPDRELEVTEGEPEEVDGATISITHTLVELVLSDTSGETATAIMPDPDILLSRSPEFLDLYAPLRLSEEADFIVAKITGERTAQEVSDRSPHGAGEVMRLLAALVITGILEPETPSLHPREVDLLPAEPPPEVPQRKLPVTWIAAAAAALVIILAGLAYLLNPGESNPAVAVGSGNEWALVIDRGCEPQDLQRVLKKAQQNPKILRPVAADMGEGEPCWRLVWGRFPTSEAAETAVTEIPADLRQQGFDPHAIQLTGEESMPPTMPEG